MWIYSYHKTKHLTKERNEEREGGERKEGRKEGREKVGENGEGKKSHSTIQYAIQKSTWILDQDYLDISQTGLMFSQFSHVVAYMNTLFFSMAE